MNRISASGIESRCLPVGKKYHLFISCRNTDEDEKWVRYLVKILTSKYSFLCCDQSDFRPGKTTVENIKYAVTKSVRTLIIMSKEYVKSYWCTFEVDFTHQMSMESRQKLIIPVLKEDCKIPDHLKPLTYIDARGDIDAWLPRLVAACESSADANYEIFADHDCENPYHNLDTVYEEPSSMWCRRVPFRSSYVPDAFDKKFFNMNADLYINVLTEISNSSFFQDRICCLPSIPSILLFLSVLSIGIFELITTILSKELKNYHPEFHHSNRTATTNSNRDFIFGCFAIVIAWLTTIIWSFRCFIHFFKDYLETVLRNAKKQLQSTKTTETFCRSDCEEQNCSFEDDTPLIHEEDTRLKEVQNCSTNSSTTAEFIAEHTDSNNDNARFKAGNPDDDDEELIVPLLYEDTVITDNPDETIFRKTTEDILINLSADFIQDFIEEKLPNSELKRHTTRALCLCQYAELKNNFIQIV